MQAKKDFYKKHFGIEKYPSKPTLSRILNMIDGNMVELKSFTAPTTVPHQYHVELLTTQYRSIPEIGEVFSRFAYGGVLKHFRTAESQRSLSIGDFIDIKPLNIIKFPVSKFESIYRPKRLQSKTPYQVYSALFAFEFGKYISSLIEMVKGDEKFRIGLIAPYRVQSDLIDKLMTSITSKKMSMFKLGQSTASRVTNVTLSLFFLIYHH